MVQIDHDRLFKELLESFFAEFLALFFPEAHAAVDSAHLRFLQQEVFTDVTAGEKHVVDILAETKLKGEEGLILVHVENQARIQPDFTERMFIYLSGSTRSSAAGSSPLPFSVTTRLMRNRTSFGSAFPSSMFSNSGSTSWN